MPNIPLKSHGLVDELFFDRMEMIQNKRLYENLPEQSLGEIFQGVFYFISSWQWLNIVYQTRSVIFKISNLRGN